MQKKTYLQQSLRNGKIMRWADNCMPLRFYIAPFRFYSKLNEHYKYIDLVKRALAEWQKASAGRITFAIVNNLHDSQINLDWKRVDRKALGHCYFNFDAQNRLYSAEVQIGLSDGILHEQYMDESEVYHTILHEIGHALGLNHSHNKDDIMYTPHQYGVVKLSPIDKLSIQWLYRLSNGQSVSEVIAKLGVGGSDIDSAIMLYNQKKIPSDFEKVKSSIQQEQKDLLTEQENIADLRKYNIALQNVKISDEVRKYFINQPSKEK